MSPTEYAEAQAHLADTVTWDAVAQAARAEGLLATDRRQLLDGLAVGLAVAFWRNQEIENVHAGADATLDPDVRRILAQQDRDMADALGDVADPAEMARMMLVCGQVDHGGGISDDIMMRANAHTAATVRDWLERQVPLTGARAYLADHPTWLSDAVGLLADPHRTVVVGGARLTASQLLGRAWGEQGAGTYAKFASHAQLGDLVGFDTLAAWYALMAVGYAGHWYPLGAWTTGVSQARQAGLLPGETERFWQALAEKPWRLSGRQARRVLGDAQVADLVQAARVAAIDATARNELSGMAAFMLI